MVCIPSSSCGASSATKPCTLFQYVDPATGICEIPNYLFMASNVAVVPPRLAIATAAPGLNMKAS